MPFSHSPAARFVSGFALSDCKNLFCHIYTGCYVTTQYSYSSTLQNIFPKQLYFSLPKNAIIRFYSFVMVKYTKFKEGSYSFSLFFSVFHIKLNIYYTLYDTTALLFTLNYSALSCSEKKQSHSQAGSSLTFPSQWITPILPWIFTTSARVTT